MAVKQALVQTTNTQGWLYIKQMADNIALKMVNEALDEEDGTKRDGKTLKASAARKCFTELWNAIEAAKGLDLQTEDPSGLGDLETQ